MSTINAIMAELQAGEAAKARVPELEASLQGCQKQIDDLAKHNQGLELRAIDREAVIDKLNADIRKLREERDDASFRELEAQDRLTTLLDTVRPVFSSLGRAIDHANPPKPQPVEVKAEPVTPPGTAGSSQQASSEPNPEPSHTVKPMGEQPGQGQSAPNPTAQIGASGTATPVTSAAAPVEKPVGASASSDPIHPYPKPWEPAVQMPPVKQEEDSGYRPFKTLDF